jgi:tRNA pseudouridine38-40 synthase
MRNIKLLLAYDGTAYLGWQKTKEGASIEETLQQVLEHILQEKIELQAASRTDAGVHAIGQVANFSTTRLNSSPARLRASLNRLLPSDIVIREVEEVPATFHPTLDCQEKEYHYQLCFGRIQLPQRRYYSWHYPYPLDVGRMQAAAQLLIGRQDFSAFCNTKKNEPYESTIRTLTKVEIVPSSPFECTIIIAGKQFLYRMVRNLVGTLVYIGRGKIQLEELLLLLKEGNRSRAGMTAPAHGLTLAKVRY